MEFISQRPLIRPTFVNVNIHDQGLWALDNARVLARYWERCGYALSLTESDEEEFNLWLRAVHQQEYVREMCAEEAT